MVNSPLAARKPAHNNACGHLSQRVGCPWLKKNVKFRAMRGVMWGRLHATSISVPGTSQQLAVWVA